MKYPITLALVLALLVPGTVRASTCENYNPYTGQCDDNGFEGVAKAIGLTGLVAGAVYACYRYRGKNKR